MAEAKPAKNQAPVAKNDTNGKDAVIEAGSSVTGDPKAKGNVLANDTDKDGDDLSVVKPGKLVGEFGSLKLSANGAWTYTLDNNDIDTEALGEGEKGFEKFKYTVSDGHGGTDTATVKITIAGSNDAPDATISLDAVTADNILNAAEANTDVAITGLVGGDVKDGDIVSIVVNGTTFTGAVAAGLFSISVPGAQLSADANFTIEASVTTGEAGNQTTASNSKTYAVDIKPPPATILVDNLTSDNIINSAEGAGDVLVTGSVGGGAKDGDIVSLIINGKTFTGAAAAGHFSIAVTGADLLADTDTTIAASVTATDLAGNSTTANNSHAYTTDTAPPVASITLNPVTGNNVVDMTEVRGEISIAGNVSGDVKNGDVVSLEINGHTYTGTVVSNVFTILVAGSDLLGDADASIHASVAVADAAGNTATAVADKTYSVDLGVDLTNLSTTLGFVIQGDAEGDNAGWSVSSAGDVNGDGIEDMIVGARFGDDGGRDAGEVYVVFGSTSAFGTEVSGRQVVDLTSLSVGQGFIIRGDTAGDLAGTSVSSAGDVNGDGLEDLIVGAPFGGDGGDAAGEAYVVFGSSTGFGVPINGRQVIDLTSLTAAQGFIIQGDAIGDFAGWSVSAAGDLNGDGIGDMVVGARLGNDGGADAGEAYVVFGSTTGFGSAVAGRQVVNLTTFKPAQGFVIQGDTADDEASRSVSSAGDVNGDGLDDLIVGAPRGDDGGSNAGEAYVVFGSSTGFGTPVRDRQVVDLTTLSATQGFLIQGDVAIDEAGISVSDAGDVNGDGLDDLIVGARSGDDGGDSAGEAYVVFGSTSGFGVADDVGRKVLDLTTLSAAQGFIIQGDAAQDDAGFSVSSAGDVNGDGFADLIVGALYGDDGGSSAGEAYVIFGSSTGFGVADAAGRKVVDLTGLTARQGFIIRGDTDFDTAGRSVSAAGDVNGDGFDDLLVGAPYGDDGGSTAGEAYVIFGAGFNGTTPVTTTGTTAAEILIGGAGKDTLAGGGGADIIRAGAGADVLGVTGGDFRKADGGNGFDTLRMDGASDSFDFAVFPKTRIDSIEAIDMGATGTQSVSLGRLDILRISDDTADGFTSLTIHGAAGDTVTGTGAGWAAAGQQTIGADTFDIFTNGHARLLVDSDITLGGALQFL